MALFLAPLRISATTVALAAVAGCTSNTEGLFGDGPGNGAAATGGDNSGAGGSNSGGSNSGGSSDGGSGTTCEPTTHDLAQRQTYVEFVIDTSGSMGTNVSGASIDRLSATLSSLSGAFANFPSTTLVGATLFPGLDDTSTEYCYAAKQNVAFAPGVDAVAAFAETYRGPNGGTPTHNAMHFGLEQLRTISPVDADRYLFLITDGMGNYGIGNADDVGHQCTGDGEDQSRLVDSSPLIEEIRAAHGNERIYTFVAGLPGSESLWEHTLHELALAGGTPLQTCVEDSSTYPCHLNFDEGPDDFRAGLIDVLGQVANVTRSCGFHLPPNTDLESVEIRYNGSKLLQHSDDCSAAGGYATLEGTSLLYLCREACAEYLGNSGKVTATLPCPTGP